jgi:hypothetical protein
MVPAARHAPTAASAVPLPAAAAAAAVLLPASSDINNSTGGGSSRRIERSEANGKAEADGGDIDNNRASRDLGASRVSREAGVGSSRVSGASGGGGGGGADVLASGRVRCGEGGRGGGRRGAL